MKIAKTAIDIPASPMEVWAILVDFDSYQKWNPFMVRGAGEAREGARLSLTMRQSNGKEMSFHPTVLTARPGEHLAWLGRLIVPKIFDGRHEFILTPTNEGTHVVQFETFTGILPPLLGSLERNVEANFRAWNEALAEYVVLQRR